jgi:hypothetical protein
LYDYVRSTSITAPPNWAVGKERVGGERSDVFQDQNLAAHQINTSP